MELQDERPVTRAEEEERLGDLYECFLSDAQEALNETAWLLVSGDLLDVPAIRARQYLQKLGLSAGQVEAFECGLYTTRQEVLSLLMCKGFSKEEVEASNLLADERWEHRLLGPLRDQEGRIRTFWSRDVANDVVANDVEANDVEANDVAFNETDSAGGHLVLDGEAPAYPFGLRPTGTQTPGRR